MSVPALLKAVEQRLREALGDPDGKAVGVQPDGRPPPGAGLLYCAVWFSGRRGSGSALDLDVTVGVTVTVTARMGRAPTDRRGERMTLDAELLGLTERVMAALHASYPAMNDATARIDGAGETTNGYVEPLVYLGDGPVQLRGPDWVWAADSAPEKTPSVLTNDVRFAAARRITALG